MARPNRGSKVLIFGLLGALGCLAGAAGGEWVYRFADTLEPKANTDGPADPGGLSILEPPKLPEVARPLKDAPPPPPGELAPAPPGSGTLPPRPPAPKELSDIITREKAKQGVIEVSLYWFDYTDLDLHVVGPDNFEICFRTPQRRGPNGGELDVDMNVGSHVSKTPIEHVNWQEGRVQSGRYKVYVHKFADHEDNSKTFFKVDVLTLNLVNGRRKYERSPTYTGRVDVKETQLVCEFDYVTLPPEPSPSPVLRMEIPGGMAVVQGGSNRFVAQIARDHFEGPVTIGVEGELDGISVKGATIPSNERNAEVEVSAREFARGGTRHLRVTARAEQARSMEVDFPVEVVELPDAIRLSAPPRITVNPGQSNTMKILVARDHFQGKIPVHCEGDTEGLDGPAVAVKEEETTGAFTIKATEQAAPGTRRLKLVANGGTATTEVPVELTIGAVSTPTQAPPSWTWFGVARIAAWTSLLALGLATILTAAQSRYLGRSILSVSGRTILAALGGLLAGGVAGGIGQILYGELSRTGMWAQAGHLAGWSLLGCLLGWGVGLFIPNLKSWKAALAGAVGGWLGSITFMASATYITSDTYGPTFSRFAGAAILGLCIGSMVALVEVLFRKYWLEVSFGERSVRTINLGDSPISVGSNSKTCAVWVSGAAPVALTYRLRDGRLICIDGVTQQEADIRPGDRRKVGTVEILAQGAGAAPPIPTPRKPAPDPIPVPIPPRPVIRNEPRPVIKDEPRSVIKDEPRSVIKDEPRSVIKDEPRPVIRDEPRPVLVEPRPSPQATPPPGAQSNACPTCGHVVPGKPGSRYCLICNNTF
jgi:hypothetical protein